MFPTVHKSLIGQDQGDREPVAARWMFWKLRHLQLGKAQKKNDFF